MTIDERLRKMETLLLEMAQNTSEFREKVKTTENSETRTMFLILYVFKRAALMDQEAVLGNLLSEEILPKEIFERVQVERQRQRKEKE